MFLRKNKNKNKNLSVTREMMILPISNQVLTLLQDRFFFLEMTRQNMGFKPEIHLGDGVLPKILSHHDWISRKPIFFRFFFLYFWQRSLMTWKLALLLQQDWQLSLFASCCFLNDKNIISNSFGSLIHFTFYIITEDTRIDLR